MDMNRLAVSQGHAFYTTAMKVRRALILDARKQFEGDTAGKVLEVARIHKMDYKEYYAEFNEKGLSI